MNSQRILTSILLLVSVLIILPAASVLAWPVPDTGQTKCYNGKVEIPCPSEGQPFFGQDGSYSINPMSYTKLDENGNDLPEDAATWFMVRDNVTGLIWEVKRNKDGVQHYDDPRDADNTYTWYDPNPATNGGNAGTPGNGTDTEDFIEDLNVAHCGGYSDWRMPTIKELASIVNYSIPVSGTSINNTYFTNTAARFHWSSTTDASYTYHAWGVSFAGGNGGHSKKANNGYVHAVHGGQTESLDHFINNGDGTVTDKDTGLMWQQDTLHDRYRWDLALSYCENSDLAGYTDWRLPTLKELRSLVDYTRWNPSINTIFFPQPNTTGHLYWSSTTLELWDGYTDCAWTLDFDDGYDSYLYSKDDNHSVCVRAVRGGQSGTLGHLMIMQTPMSGPPGTTFVKQGAGATSNSTATLHLLKPDDTEDPPQTISINPSGYFEIFSAASYDTLPGTYTWWVVDDTTGWVSNRIAYEITQVREGLSALTISDIVSPQQAESASKTVSPQQVRESFVVTITALDHNGQVMTGFNDWVQLKCSTGDYGISPTAIKLSSGQWSGPVTLLDGGDNIWVEARSGVIVGRSNSFSLEVGTLPSGIYGMLLDTHENPLSAVNMRISSASKVYEGRFDKEYAFTGIPPGMYTVKATHLSSGEIALYPNISIPSGLPIDQPIRISINAPGDKIPVLLVPGIMGSAWELSESIFPVLPKEQGSHKLQLHNPKPFDKVGWHKLTKELETAGYLKDKTLFEVPYDWRMDIDDIVDKYLIPAINDAIRISGKDKVSIIAHSMGGLVVRSYIQGSPRYHGYSTPERSDIFRFAMVGTPNQGAPIAYYLWEGGDPALADIIREDWKLSFYFRTTVENMPMIMGLFLNPYIDQIKIYKFFHNQEINGIAYGRFTGLEWLLPVNDFLGPLPFKSLVKEPNRSLKRLNSAASSLMGLPGTGKIDTVIFAGTGEKTVRAVEVGAGNNINRYQDGNPMPMNNQRKSAFIITAGDGTVPLSSALLPYNEGWADKKELSGEHSSLVRIFAKDLVQFVEQGTFEKAAALPAKSLALTEETASSTLAVSIVGPVRAMLVNPAGLASGIQPGTGEYKNAIPETEMTQLADGGYIAVTNPANGQYALSLSGTVASDFMLEISYNGADASYTANNRKFNNQETILVIFTLEAAAEPKIRIINLPLAPENLAADMTTDGTKLTRLTWSSAEDEMPTVTGYNIYSRMPNEPRFYLIGTTSDTSFASSHPWTENNAVLTRIYCVTALADTGTESFFSYSATNDDRDHDGVSDAEEASLATNVSLPDSDGDGLKDGDEYYLYGTSPLLKDTDGDGYLDKDELDGGSDPLDKGSIPVPKGVIPAINLLLLGS